MRCLFRFKRLTLSFVDIDSEDVFGYPPEVCQIVVVQQALRLANSNMYLRIDNPAAHSSV